MNMFAWLKKTLYNPVRSRVKKWKESIYFLGFLWNRSYQNYGKVKDDHSLAKRRLLFVGSGKSALEHQQYDLSGFQILTINNSIKAFQRPVDFYLCSTNFPTANKPDPAQYSQLIKKVNYFYDTISYAFHYRLGFRPQVGKTIFLDGLY